MKDCLVLVGGVLFVYLAWFVIGCIAILIDCYRDSRKPNGQADTLLADNKEK